MLTSRSLWPSQCVGGQTHLTEETARLRVRLRIRVRTRVRDEADYVG